MIFLTDQVMKNKQAGSGPAEGKKIYQVRKYDSESRQINEQSERQIYLSLKLKKMAKKSVFTRIDRVNTRNEQENI